MLKQKPYVAIRIFLSIERARKKMHADEKTACMMILRYEIEDA